MILPSLAAVAFACSVAAILIDDLPSQPADSVSFRAVYLSLAVSGEPGGYDVWSALASKDKIPPLPVLIAGLLVALLGDTLFALRLGGVLCLALLMLQARDLALRCGASRRAGQWAALLIATTPMVFSWSRLAYADIYVAVAHMACLQVMARGMLTPRRALLLGLVGGLGVLCKLSFFVYMLGPALYFLVAHLKRARQQALNLALLLIGAGVTSGWWLWMQAGIIYENFFHYTQAWNADESFMFQGHSALKTKLTQMASQLWEHPGLPLVWIGAALGLIIWRTRPRAPVRAMLGLGSLLCLGTLLLFDPGSRYLVPMMPPALALSALALDPLIRWRGVPARVLETVAALALVGWFAHSNLVHKSEANLRFNSSGMLAPITGYVESCRELARSRNDLAIYYIELATAEWLHGLSLGAGRQCKFPDHTPDPDKPCHLVVRFTWIDHEDDKEVWPAGYEKRCPNLKLLNRFGKLANIEFAVVDPALYTGWQEGENWQRRDDLIEYPE